MRILLKFEASFARFTNAFSINNEKAGKPERKGSDSPTIESSVSGKDHQRTDESANLAARQKIRRTVMQRFCFG